jgi:hypothetical protein
MTISKHIISPANGTEYFEITFNVVNQKDITYQQYKNIETLIYIELQKIKNDTK